LIDHRLIARRAPRNAQGVEQILLAEHEAPQYDSVILDGYSHVSIVEIRIDMQGGLHAFLQLAAGCRTRLLGLRICVGPD
jgi:hypothetical protein